MPFSPSLIAAVSIQLGCQLFKVFYYSAKDRRFSIRWFFTAGGMPSAHTAFVSALAVSVGLHRGLSSEIFAVAFVFAVIVVYDILRVRAAVQAHSNILLSSGSKRPQIWALRFAASSVLMLIQWMYRS